MSDIEIYNKFNIFDVEILLSVDVKQQERLDAATRIINTYELPLTQQEIIAVFNEAICDINGMLESRYRHERLFKDLLRKNKNLFVAVVKAFNNNDNIFELWSFTVLLNGLEIGLCKSSYKVSIYFRLLDYNDFEIDDLSIKQYYKSSIQKYRLKKYGGKLTKLAIDN